MKKVLLVIFSFFVGLAAKAQVTNYQNWMAQLDDDAFVCQLSIPGAHDACASSFSGWDALGAAVSGKVQTKSVEQMLPLGTRLFDLRPAVNGNKLTIYHGVLQTAYNFNDVMQQLCNYVTTHPTEFCVVVIRHETDGDDNNANFGSMLQTSLTQFSDYLVNFRPNLTVGEARGKILFLSRDEY
ncbi:MAG: phosphatidylinositol-specific phospholipase C domain-containing protein, partial [Bacteroidaceae bacterium]|nr:phosphatidylinositol-specific phospholipase C domain-containing protein [Bacteroidaceae bacterium]